MNPQGGHNLNLAAVLSPLGAVRLTQLAFGCAAVALVTHSGVPSGAHGVFCLASWSACFALSAAIFSLDVTHLRWRLPLSWENLTVTVAAVATLLLLTASVVYPVYFVRSECPHNDCEARNLRIAAAVCSWVAWAAYGAEVFRSRAAPGRTVAYMATPSGLLKVAEVYVGCAIFLALFSGSEFWRHTATAYCVAAFAACLAGTTLAVAVSVRGRPVLPCHAPARFAPLSAFAAVLLYLSASVTWSVFSFDRKYGSPLRPQGCPRGKCAWDGQLAVAVLSFINLALYIADLCYSQRTHHGTQQPRV
ncbi:myeloid-associated differentiation marker-like protein 2 [Brachyhypopomus gauderio]|uniref:myeloid-associated differentiation marker-like protein 2 n=1 Tax=Brachyhypopomus gauderio TaxID=698409 RepID=UPI004041A7F8